MSIYPASDISLLLLLFLAVVIAIWLGRDVRLGEFTDDFDFVHIVHGPRDIQKEYVRIIYIYIPGLRY